MVWNLIKLQAVCVLEFGFKWEDIDCDGTSKNNSKIFKGDKVEVILSENTKNPEFNTYTIKPNPTWEAESCIIKKDKFKKYFKIV